MKERVLFLDSLKGLLILFVIYYHILWAGVKFKESPTVDIFDTTCMQLFFFVSGFLLNSTKGWSNYHALSFLRKKVTNIFIPTFLMFSISIMYFDLDLFYWIYAEFKNGYWFTYVLFFIFLIHYSIYNIFGKGDLNVRCELSLVILFGSASLFSAYTYRFFDYPFFHYISLQFIFKFNFYFLLGYLWKSHQIFFDNIISNKLFSGFVLVVSLIPTHLILDEKLRMLCLFAVSTSRVIAIFWLFEKKKPFTCQTFVSTQVRKLGKRSFEIYLLHYFFIFGMPGFLPLLQEQEELYVIRGAGNPLAIELLIIVPVSVLIAYLCIFIREFLNFSPWISKLFLGPIVSEH